MMVRLFDSFSFMAVIGALYVAAVALVVIT